MTFKNPSNKDLGFSRSFACKEPQLCRNSSHEKCNTGSSWIEPAVPTLCIFADSELLVLLGVNKGLIACSN